MHHGDFYCSLSCGVHANHSLFRTHTFESQASLHKRQKAIVQCLIQVNQKTHFPLLINIDVTPSIYFRGLRSNF